MSCRVPPQAQEGGSVPGNGFLRGWGLPPALPCPSWRLLQALQLGPGLSSVGREPVALSAPLLCLGRGHLRTAHDWTPLCVPRLSCGPNNRRGWLSYSPTFSRRGSRGTEFRHHDVQPLACPWLLGQLPRESAPVPGPQLRPFSAVLSSLRALPAPCPITPTPLPAAPLHSCRAGADEGGG